VIDAVASLDAGVVRRHYERSQAVRWGVRVDAFADALARSVTGRFRGSTPSSGDVASYLDALHVADLALACACAEGLDAAWDHFVLEFRPVLYRTAEALRVPGDARELADGLYAELFGLEERDGVRRSLFRYFHGRSSLAGWLRTVVAQRAVDRARASRRLVPLGDEGNGGTAAVEGPGVPVNAGASGAGDGGTIDPHRPRLLALLRTALASAFAALDPGTRLRLALYYTKGLKLAQIGRVVGESEATVSRKLDRARKGIRSGVEQGLRDAGLGDAQVALCFEYAQSDPQFDLTQALPVPDS
jgi:RNA polymerase sigma-70 factor (ECF subfamily)